MDVDTGRNKGGKIRAPTTRRRMYPVQRGGPETSRGRLEEVGHRVNKSYTPGARSSQP